MLDIDPGPDVTWPQVIAAARLVRRLLHAVDLESFVKNPGGRGLHVVVPLRAERDWSECLAFSRAFAERIAADDPSTFTTACARAGRERKIPIDDLRNNRTNTPVAAFSTRRKPHAPVSMPLKWDELDPKVPADHFTALTVPDRLRRLRRDPWDAYWRARQRIATRAFDSVIGRSTSVRLSSARAR